jgi:protein pelota
VEPGSEVKLRKARGFRRHHEERIEEAIAATAKPLVTILAMEENEAVVAVLRQYGVQKMADVAGHVSGKRHAPTKGDEEAFFDEILLALRDYRPEGQAPLLVLGPGFAKERFLAYARAKEPALVKGAAVEGTGQAGMTGIHEALKRGVVDRVAKDQRVARETALVERFLEAVAADKPAAYGLAHVRRAAELGAAEVVLVTDALVREGAGEALLDVARATGAEAHVVSTLHEAGKRLGSLGGAGALLRYRVA